MVLTTSPWSSSSLNTSHRLSVVLSDSHPPWALTNSHRSSIGSRRFSSTISGSFQLSMDLLSFHWSPPALNGSHRPYQVLITSHWFSPAIKKSYWLSLTPANTNFHWFQASHWLSVDLSVFYSFSQFLTSRQRLKLALLGLYTSIGFTDFQRLWRAST